MNLVNLEMRNPPAASRADTAGDGLLHIADVKKSSRLLKKWRRVLLALAQGRSLNRFEAERSLSDHCLHSTVSEIQGRGIRVDRVMETVPGYCGMPTRVARYWLAPEQRTAALALLGR
jgi:hypothetical protein